MYPYGHYGVSLLVYAPLGALLLLAGEPELAVVAGVVMLSLAMLPDVDRQIPGIKHRGITHTLAFAVAVGALFAVAGRVLAGTPELVGTTGVGLSGLVAVGFAVGFLTVLAHLLADVLTPTGVAFLWPLSRKPYSLNLCRADSSVANYALLAVGVGVASSALYLLVRVGG